MAASDKVLLDWPAPEVARLRINRPEKRNAIDHDVRHQLLEALNDLVRIDKMRALVLGGVGGQFSAGGDLPSMVGLTPANARARMQHVASLCLRVAEVSVPVLTAVEGASAGGSIGLALLGDVIVVGDGTRVRFPFLKLGLVPDWGSLYSLPHRVGLQTARRLLLSGESITGAEAYRVGLADELVADADVMDATVRRAAELAALPRGAFARLKSRLGRLSTTLGEALEREVEDQTELLCGAEFREGYGEYMRNRSRAGKQYSDP